MNKTMWGVLTAWLVLGGCGPQKPAGDAGGQGEGIHGGHEVKGEASDEADEHAPPAPSASAAAPAPVPGGPIALEALLPVPDPGPPPGFPAATVSDKDCTKSVGLTGNLARDFAALTAACGASAGMKEYAKMAGGSLGTAHPRETFEVKLAGGYCYRFFAMADGSIDKLNLRIERPNGAMHSVITGKQAVILLRPGEAWCRRRDRDFRVIVEAPAGEGHFSFGIWARPSEKGRAK